MEMKDDFVSRTIKTEKLFNFNAGHCLYINIEITKKNDKSDQDSQIKITNNICKINDYGMSKTTEVRFGNRLICIEDNYNFKTILQIGNESNIKNESNPTNSSDGSQNNHDKFVNATSLQKQYFQNRKKQIFKKKGVNQNLDNRLLRRNTKNIAKNFCKAFVSFLEQQKEIIAISKIKEMISKYKFNNKMIEKIATDDTIGQIFKKFLRTRAEQWISSSKIHDKQIHLQAIRLYLQLADQEFQKSMDSQDELSQSSQSIYHSDENYQSLNRYDMKQDKQK